MELPDGDGSQAYNYSQESIGRAMEVRGPVLRRVHHLVQGGPSPDHGNRTWNLDKGSVRQDTGGPGAQLTCLRLRRWPTLQQLHIACLMTPHSTAAHGLVWSIMVCRVAAQARDFGANRSLAYQDVASMLSQMLGGRNIPYGQIFNGLKQAFGGSQPQAATL